MYECIIMEWRYVNSGILYLYMTFYWILLVQLFEYTGKSNNSGVTKTSSVSQHTIRYTVSELLALKSRFKNISENNLDTITTLGIKRTVIGVRGKRRLRPRVRDYNNGVHQELLRCLPKSCVQLCPVRPVILGLVNTRSINNKVNQLIHQFKCLNLDICCITESWVKDCQNVSDDLSSAGLSIINIARPSRTGGGIAIVTLSKIISKLLKSGELTSFEYGIFSIKIHGKELIIAIIYRIPYSSNHRVTSAKFFQEFPDFLDNLMSSYQDVLILGDFNIPWNIIDNVDTISLMELAELYGLKQHVCMSTHTSGNMLDLMFSTSDSRLKLSKPRSSYFISDHCFIAVDISIYQPTVTKKKIMYRKLKCIDNQSFRKSLSVISEKVLAVGNINEA